MYDNLVKIILFALPTNFAQGFCILMALIIGLPVPLTPIQVRAAPALHRSRSGTLSTPRR